MAFSKLNPIKQVKSHLLGTKYSGSGRDAYPCINHIRPVVNIWDGVSRMLLYSVRHMPKEQISISNQPGICFHLRSNITRKYRHISILLSFTVLVPIRFLFKKYLVCVVSNIDNIWYLLRIKIFVFHYSSCKSKSHLYQINAGLECGAFMECLGGIGEMRKSNFSHPCTVECTLYTVQCTGNTQIFARTSTDTILKCNSMELLRNPFRVEKELKVAYIL